jgi:cell division transport system permease protein
MRPIFPARACALRRNAAPSAVATVLITTLVLGVFIPVVRAAARNNEVRNKIELGSSSTTTPGRR